MNKLKQKIKTTILTYQNYLKNNELNKNFFQSKYNVYESQILFKNNETNIINLQNNANIYIPLTVLDHKDVFSIQKKYDNQYLFNYNLNYNIIYNFNKFLLKKKIEENKRIIKARTIKHYKRHILIAIFGIVFSIRSSNLSKLINKRVFFLKKNKNKKFKKYLYIPKKLRSKDVINSYKLRYLNFKIKNKNLYEYSFSRIDYLEDLLKYKKNKKPFFKKNTWNRKKKKKKNATI